MATGNFINGSGNDNGDDENPNPLDTIIFSFAHRVVVVLKFIYPTFVIQMTVPILTFPQKGFCAF